MNIFQRLFTLISLNKVNNTTSIDKVNRNDNALLDSDKNIKEYDKLRSSNRESAGYKAAIIFIAAIFLIALAVVSICFGAVSITLKELLSVLTGFDTTSKFYQIILYVRLPRTIAAILAGCSLAVAGAILQTVLNNALAGPNIIGVNAGSGLFTIILAAFFPSMIRYVPIAAFLGALFAVLIVYFVASRTGASRMTIVLAGTAVSSFISAFTDTILTIAPNAQFSRMDFLIGSFSGVSMENVKFTAGYILLGIAAALFLSYDMNLLSLGDETAASLGLRVNVYRMIFLIIAALLSGSAVSFSGLIGFVGLIVPHAARIFVGYDNRFLIPMCIMLGGAFTLGCDILSRILFSPFEIPVGIIMSFLGGPFFIYLLLSRKGRRLLD